MKLQTAADEGNASLSDVIVMLGEAKIERKRMETELGKSLDACHEKIDENKATLNN